MFQSNRFPTKVTRLRSTGFVAFFLLTQLLAINLVAQEESNSDESKAQDQTLDEFRKYATEKMPSLSDAKIDLIVERVDKNSDGIISEAEFAERVRIFRAVARGPQPWLENLEMARAVAKEEGKPLLIYARADWCLACKQLEKDTLPLEAVQNEMKEFVLLRLVIDKNEDAVAELGITAIPTLIVETPDGESFKSVGVKGQAQLVEWMSESSGSDDEEDKN